MISSAIVMHFTNNNIQNKLYPAELKRIFVVSTEVADGIAPLRTTSPADTLVFNVQHYKNQGVNMIWNVNSSKSF